MKFLTFVRSAVGDSTVEHMDLEPLLRRPDHGGACLLVRAPTEGPLNRERLSPRKPDAVHVNIGVNSILDDVALGELLHTGQWYGAGLEPATAPELFSAPPTTSAAGGTCPTGHEASTHRVETFTYKVEAMSRGKLAALMVVGAFALSACGSTAEINNTVPGAAVTSATSTPSTSPEQTKAPISDSEAKYALYYGTLTPEQKAVRESLSPDNLQGRTPEEVAVFFKISIREVAAVDGKTIDPLKYAEAFIAREEALLMLGSSLKDFHEKGGLNGYNSDDLDKTGVRFIPLVGKAFLGYEIADSKSNTSTLTRFLAVASAKEFPQDGLMVNEYYHSRIVVVPGSTRAEPETVPGKLDLKIGANLTDNWPKEAMAKRNGLIAEPGNMTGTWYVTGLYTDAAGNVYPNKVVLNSQPAASN